MNPPNRLIALFLAAAVPDRASFPNRPLPHRAGHFTIRVLFVEVYAESIPDD